MKRFAVLAWLRALQARTSLAKPPLTHDHLKEINWRASWAMHRLSHLKNSLPGESGVRLLSMR